MVLITQKPCTANCTCTEMMYPKFHHVLKSYLYGNRLPEDLIVLEPHKEAKRVYED